MRRIFFERGQEVNATFAWYDHADRVVYRHTGTFVPVTSAHYDQELQVVCIDQKIDTDLETEWHLDVIHWIPESVRVLMTIDTEAQAIRHAIYAADSWTAQLHCCACDDTRTDDEIIELELTP
jgi:hypothetical protein